MNYQELNIKMISLLKNYILYDKFQLLVSEAEEGLVAHIVDYKH